MAFFLRRFSSSSSATMRLYQPGICWSQLLLLSNQQRRFFGATAEKADVAASSQEEENKKQNNIKNPKKKSSPLELISKQRDNWDRLVGTACTGTGQVIFLNSHDAGTVILVSLALADPMVAFMAGTGSFVSSITAETTLSSTTASSTKNGLFSYNGCLVGCATAGLICPGSFVTALPVTMVGAAAATYVTATPMTSSMPQWTIAFNLLTYPTLLALYKPMTTATAATVTTVQSAPTVFDLIVSPLTGIGQIFVVESAISGFGIVLAMARYSPQVALHAVLGSAVGSITGAVCLGADAIAISAGLWGYNSALTSAGTAVFLRSNTDGTTTNTVWWVSGVGASLTAITFGALSTISPVPCLTIPFCIVMSGIWSLAHGKLVGGVELSNAPHSPERNQY